MQTETFTVTGMTCDGCTSKVAHALNAITGVHEVVVSLATGEAAVRYDEHLTATDKLESAVKGAGYGVDLAHAAHSSQSKGGCCT
jgi:copper chaperone